MPFERASLEEPRIELDRSGEALPGNAHQQEQWTMDSIPNMKCPRHAGEYAYTQVAEGGEVLYSCRVTGERVYDQDAVG